MTHAKISPRIISCESGIDDNRKLAALVQAEVTRALAVEEHKRAVARISNERLIVADFDATITAAHSQVAALQNMLGTASKSLTNFQSGGAANAETVEMLLDGFTKAIQTWTERGERATTQRASLYRRVIKNAALLIDGHTPGPIATIVSQARAATSAAKK